MRAWQVVVGVWAVFMAGGILNGYLRSTAPTRGEQIAASFEVVPSGGSAKTAVYQPQRVNTADPMVMRIATAFRLEATQANLQHISNVLGALEAKSNVSRNEIARCAQAMAYEVDLSRIQLRFPDAAGICTASMAN